jgi:hypothetical protein
MKSRFIFLLFVSIIFVSCGGSRKGEQVAMGGGADTLIVGDGTATSASDVKNSASQKLKPVVPEKAKSFEDFAVSEIYGGKPAKPDLGSHPPLSKYKTVITRGTKRGVNFAGKYAFVTWGCGTGCQQSAIVDVTNGRIFPGKEATAGYSFKISSRFLVVNPRDTTMAMTNAPKPEYYVWENETLTPVEP